MELDQSYGHAEVVDSVTLITYQSYAPTNVTKQMRATHREMQYQVQYKFRNVYQKTVSEAYLN